MNLAYKKILGKFTKVLGFGKTPPPCWEKFPNNIVFFFESAPKHCGTGTLLSFHIIILIISAVAVPLPVHGVFIRFCGILSAGAGVGGPPLVKVAEHQDEKGEEE